MLLQEFPSSHFSKHGESLKYPGTPGRSTRWLLARAASSPARLCRAGRDVVKTSERRCRPAEPFRGGLRSSGEAAPLARRSARPGARGAAPIAPPSRLPAERHSPDWTGSRQQLSASPEKARTAARAGGSIGSGRRAAPRSQAAAPALRGWQAAGKSAKCGKRRPYSMCPVSAPRRGAEWQMRDPITSHVTGKDRDRHPNLLRRGTAGLPLPLLTPTRSGWCCSPRGSALAPRSPPR